MKNDTNVYKELRESTETDKTPALTQGQLSALFHEKGFTISQSVISKLETNKNTPPTTSYEIIKAYSKVFNTTADYLLGLRDTKPIDENIAMVNRITGLNENAINTLKNFLFLDNGYIDTLNFILSHGYFFEFIRGLKLYIENNYNTVMIDKIVPGTKSVEYVPREVPEINKDGKEIFWLGKKTNNGYSCIPLSTDIVEAHAMLIIQDALKKFQEKYKKERD